MHDSEKIFQNLVKIGLIDEDGNRRFGEYVKLEAEGFMDLSVDFLSEKPPFYRIAMAHNGVQNGDLMADPDMEILIDTEKKAVMPLTFQNDYVGVYQQVVTETEDGKVRTNVSLQSDLEDFLLTWTQNLIDQGFKHE